MWNLFFGHVINSTVLQYSFLLVREKISWWHPLLKCPPQTWWENDPFCNRLVNETDHHIWKELLYKPFIYVLFYITYFFLDIYSENYNRDEHLFGVFYLSIVLFSLLSLDMIDILRLISLLHKYLHETIDVLYDFFFWQNLQVYFFQSIK